MRVRLLREKSKFTNAHKHRHRHKLTDNIKRIKWDLRFEVKEDMVQVYIRECARETRRENFVLKALKIDILSTSCASESCINVAA